MEMSQPSSKGSKFVPLRMSELMPNLLALQEAADDESNSCSSSPDRSFSDSDTHKRRNQSAYKTEVTYPDDNYNKNSFLSDSRSCNQTFPNNDNMTAQNNKSHCKMSDAPPMKTPIKSKQTSAIKFKTRTPRSSAKKFTPSRLRLKGSSSKGSAKKSTPMKTSLDTNEGYRSSTKCALFPAAKPPYSSTKPQLLSGDLISQQKNILKPTEELLPISLNKCIIISPEIDKKNSLNDDKCLGMDTVDRIKDLRHVSRTYDQYQPDRFAAPLSGNLSVNSILRGCRENELITPNKPINPPKMLDYHTPAMRGRIMQSNSKHARTPLFPIKPDQFSDSRNEPVKDRSETHLHLHKSLIDDKENQTVFDSKIENKQLYPEAGDLNSNISDEDLKMITASWEISGIEPNISLSKDVKPFNDSSFQFETPIKTNKIPNHESNWNKKPNLNNQHDLVNAKNNINSGDIEIRPHSIFKPKTFPDKKMAYSESPRLPTVDYHAPKINQHPTSLNINYQSGSNPLAMKMQPPTKTVSPIEIVQKKQLLPVCQTDQKKQIEDVPKSLTTGQVHSDNIGNRTNNVDKILLAKSNDALFKNPSPPLRACVESTVRVNNANVLSKEFRTLTVNRRHYTILGKLGFGGSSEVFKVMDPDTTLMYAVKCVNLAVHPSFAQGYIDEINLLKRLQGCDKVITMFDNELLEKEAKLYVVLEMGESDLSSLMKSYSSKGRRLPLLILMAYWTEMLAAVNYIHKNGVIHSDLKPANFLLVHGRLKLIDFGIASSISAEATSVVKDSTTGTFQYISPEAIDGGREPIKITYKSDVWSLGCILYRMIYGRTPFGHITKPWAIVAAVSNPNQKIDYPETKGIPPVLMTALKWCLTFNVKTRPTVQQLMDLPYVNVGNDECPKPTGSAKSIPVTILSKIRQTLTDDEWRKFIGVLEST